MMTIYDKNATHKRVLTYLKKVIVNLIANTTTKNGLKIRAEKDENIYQKGIKISNEEMAKLKWQKKILELIGIIQYHHKTQLLFIYNPLEARVLCLYPFLFQIPFFK